MFPPPLAGQHKGLLTLTWVMILEQDQAGISLSADGLRISCFLVKPPRRWTDNQDD